MKVENVMTAEVGVCALGDDLSKAVEVMRQKSCGAVPVVDAENRLAGILTVRDICFFLAANDKKSSEVKVSELIDGEETVRCAPDDKIEAALKKMRGHQLKRLPVVGETGEVAGILSVNDVLRPAGKDKKLKKRIYKTLREIAAPRPIVLREIDDATEEARASDGT